MSVIEEYVDLINNFILNSRESISYLAVNQTMMKLIPDCFGEDFYVIDLKNDLSPLKPFSGIIKNMNLPDEVLKKELYSLQTPAFLSYLKNGICDEREDVIFEQEFYYEKSLLQTSVANLISKYNADSYIFINAQYMFNESFEIIKLLEKLNIEGRLVFCFDSINSEIISKDVSKFLDHISNQRNFLHLVINDDSDLFSDKKNYLNMQFVSHDAVFNEIKDFDSIYTNLKNYRLLLAYDQASVFCSWTIKNLQNLSITHAQKRILFKEIAQIQFETGNPDEAVLFLNNIIDYQNDDDIEIWAYYYMARVFSKKKSNSVAQKYALLAQKHLESNTDTPLYALSLMMEYFVLNRVNNKNLIQKYMSSLDALETTGLFNNYVATAVKIPWEMLEKTEYHKQIFEILDKCFSYSSGLGNKHLYSSVFHWKGIVLSQRGERDEAMKHFEECNKIRTEIGEIGPLLAIRNGLSYEFLCRGLYVKAYNTINEIVEKLYNVDDFSTIIDTLKNLSHAIFYIRRFDEADKILEMILYFLNLFKLTNSANNSFLPSINDILIYRSLIDLHKGDYIHAKMNYLTITQNNINIGSVDKPLLHLIKAIILIQEKKINDAHIEFKAGLDEYESLNQHQEHKIVFMYYEFAKHLNRIGYKADSESYLNEGFSQAKKYGFTYYTKNSNEPSLSDYLNGVHNIVPVKINLQFLLEKAEKDKLLNVLHGRIHEYQFLNKIRSFNSDSTGLKKYLEKVCSTIFEYTMTQGIFIAEKINGKWKRLYSATTKKAAVIDEKDSLLVLNKNLSVDSCQLYYNADNEIYYANLSKYDFTGGIIIVPSQLGLFETEILEILNIALTNIQAQIVMVRQNEHLLFVSSTDQLSLVKNRHSLQEYLLMESERIDRFLMRKKVLIHCTIGFIDLDNFKYYNDTFGHAAGDLFIKCFGSLLKKTLRKIDFVSRYGGDEFVVVLNDTNLEEGKRVQGRLLEGLEREDFFIPQLKDLLKIDEVNIPAGKQLGFSMGLCSNLDLEDPADLNKVMENADKALYYVKHTKKGTVACWSDIKNK